MPKVDQIRNLTYNNEDIGQGFNSDTGLAVGTALDFDPPVKGPGQEAQSDVTIVTSHEELIDTLNMSAAAQGHYLFSSASLKASFANNTGYNTASTFVVARSVINNEITRGQNFRVKPDAQRLLNAPTTEEFTRAFGDSFVRGQLTGGEFYAVMRITSVDTSTQTSLTADLKAELGNPLLGGSFDAHLQMANKDSRTRSDFSVQFYQKGGAGKEEIGTTLSVQDVKDRLQNLPSGVQNHPFPYEIEVATYDTVPIPLPTKEQKDDFLLAFADANRQKLRFIEGRNDMQFAQNILSISTTFRHRKLLHRHRRSTHKLSMQFCRTR
jgi:hypothetical protein